MKEQSFTVTIRVANSPADVFDCILEVPKWWTTDFEGACKKLDDEFVICHPGAHYSKHKLVDLIPGRRIEWLVTDSKLDWLQKNMAEWTNTKMVFEITTDGDETVLHYTHEGLVPALECYDRVTQGWDMVIKKNLYNFLTGC